MYDSETEFYHFYARKYDPANGVWTTPDPIGIMGGLNLYMYCWNNPVKYFDPTGHYSFMDDGNDDTPNNQGNYGSWDNDGSGSDGSGDGFNGGSEDPEEECEYTSEELQRILRERYNNRSSSPYIDPNRQLLTGAEGGAYILGAAAAVITGWFAPEIIAGGSYLYTETIAASAFLTSTPVAEKLFKFGQDFITSVVPGGPITNASWGTYGGLTTNAALTGARIMP